MYNQHPTLGHSRFHYVLVSFPQRSTLSQSTVLPRLLLQFGNVVQGLRSLFVTDFGMLPRYSRNQLRTRLCNPVSTQGDHGIQAINHRPLGRRRFSEAIDWPPTLPSCDSRPQPTADDSAQLNIHDCRHDQVDRLPWLLGLS